jgi:hypothetical protein
VTASDDSFVGAVEVMLFSFLRRNPWFRGDLVAIDSGLGEASRERLSKHGPIRFLPPGEDLARANALLGEAVPRVAEIRPRFDKLEFFRIGGYDRLVFLDGDILVNGSLRELFETGIPLGACPERTHVFGHRRGRRTYRCYRPEDDPDEPLVDPEYNTGVVTADGASLGEGVFGELLALLDPAHWAEILVPGIADQIVFNWRLARQTTPLDHRFNFMPRLESAMGRFHGIGWRDARVHHYADAFKPWILRNPEAVAYRAPELLKYWELWKTEEERMEEAGSGPADWGAERARHDILCRALMDPPSRVMNWRLDWRFQRVGHCGVLPPEFEFNDDAAAISDR